MPLAAKVTDDFCRFLEIGISEREMLSAPGMFPWKLGKRQLERAVLNNYKNSDGLLDLLVYRIFGIYKAIVGNWERLIERACSFARKFYLLYIFKRQVDSSLPSITQHVNNGKNWKNMNIFSLLSKLVKSSSPNITRIS